MKGIRRNRGSSRIFQNYSSMPSIAQTTLTKSWTYLTHYSPLFLADTAFYRRAPWLKTGDTHQIQFADRGNCFVIKLTKSNRKTNGKSTFSEQISRYAKRSLYQKALPSKSPKEHNMGHDPRNPQSYPNYHSCRRWWVKQTFYQHNSKNTWNNINRNGNLRNHVSSLSGHKESDSFVLRKVTFKANEK